MKTFNKEEWDFGPDSKMVILTGSGISADSGIPTFRTGEDGLWLNYPIDVIAHPRGLAENREQFIEFYNRARKICSDSKPNDGHKYIDEIQDITDAYLITQNIDNLHERGGSYQVAHMHGSLYESVCEGEDEHVFQQPVHQDINKPCAHCLHLLRPNITLFTEEPQYLAEIYEKLDECTHLVLVGTSGEVYPAAGFKEYVRGRGAKVLNINLEIEPDYHINFCLHMSATNGLRLLHEALQ